MPNCALSFSLHVSLVSHVYRNHINKKSDKGTQLSEQKCSVASCNFKTFLGTEKIISHLKFHIREGQSVQCPYPDCTQSFTNISTFSSHRSRVHKKGSLKNQQHAHSEPMTRNEHDLSHVELNLGAPDNDVHPVWSSHTDADDVYLGQSGNNVCPVSSFNSEELKQQIQQKLALFLLQLQSKHHVPEKNINSIISEFQGINEAVTDNIVEHVRFLLSSCETEGGEKLSPTFINSILEIIECDPLGHCLNTKHGTLRSPQQRQLFYKSHFNYVAPISYDIDDGRSHFHYVPILDSLKALYNDPKILETLHKSQSPFGVLTDYNDGTIFRDSDFFKNNPAAVQLILYQDSFELCNPLGASKKKHKLLAIYYMLGNLHSSRRSAIDPMQLVLLCKEGDFKRVGARKVLQPLLNDLHVLEDEGIYLGESIGKQKGSVLFILGDNLGSHMIGGFTENFCTENFCRFCLFPKSDLQLGMAVNKNYPARTKANYHEALQNKDQSAVHFQGIKSNSVFNDLKNFHVATPGLPPCLGHDLFEGIVKSDLHLFLKYFVNEKKWFTYDQLNLRIEKLKLKGAEVHDKPPQMSENSVQGHAVQVWTFLRFLPLYIGDKITETDDRVWQLLLLLRNVVSIICKKSLNTDDIINMNDQIQEYLEERYSCFPNEKLKPKHHFISHYPQLSMQCGPLIHLWTLRFESKHGYFKNCARSTKNFKNITHSLSLKHQLLQALYSQGSLFQNEILHESADVFNPQIYNDSIQEAVKVMAIKLDENTLACRKMVYRGTHYQAGQVLLLQTANNEDKMCGEIILILVHLDSIIFIVYEREVEYLSDVGILKILPRVPHAICVPYHCLLDGVPLDIYNNEFIILKHGY
jgi:hypothetical protein